MLLSELLELDSESELEGSDFTSCFGGDFLDNEYMDANIMSGRKRISAVSPMRLE